MHRISWPFAVVLGSALAAHAQAPYLVEDLWPGPGGGVQWNVVAAGDRVFFPARDPDLGLGVSGGTAASTAILDLGFDPFVMFPLGGDALFRNRTSPSGLWRSDGTPGGTRPISDVEPALWAYLAAVAPDRVFFGANVPYVTDGTDEGTFAVPPPLGGLWSPPSPRFGVSAPFAGGFAFLRGHSGGVWFTDGRLGGGTTRLMADDRPCASLAASDGRLFMVCTEASVVHLWVGDGTFSGAQLVATLPITSPLMPIAGGVAFLVANGSAMQLWRSDGTAGGTFALPATYEVTTLPTIETGTVSDGVLYFRAATPSTGWEPWRTDGTVAGTFLLRDIEPGPFSSLEGDVPGWIVADGGGGVVLVAQTSAGGRELWASDGTAAGTVALPEVHPGPAGSNARDLARAGGRVFFAAIDAAHGGELWALDLPPGSVAVGDTAVGEGDTGTAAATFAVRLESASDSPVLVSYATVPGTAQAGVDYLPQSGTLTFAPGTRELTVDVPVLGDLADETNETFTLELSPAAGVRLSDRRGAAVILDDDAPGVAAEGTAAGEGSGQALFAVRVTTQGGPTVRPVAVHYAAVGGTATAGADFAAAQGTVTFPAGSPSGTAVTVSVPIVDDAIDEPDETFLLALDGQGAADVPAAPAVGVILDDDGVPAARPLELSHGARYRGDLAPPPGATQDRDYYVMQQQPHASYELVVDEVSGDAVPLSVERVAGDGTSVVQSAVPVGAGGGLSLRWRTATSASLETEHVRLESATCGSACGADDTYRLRFYETTMRAARFNNAGGQATVVVLQNTSPEPIGGTVFLWVPEAAGAQGFTIAPHGTYLFDTSRAAAFLAGSLTIAHDGPYGALVGKAVALEPATGFSFDTPLTPRPR